MEQEISEKLDRFFRQFKLVSFLKNQLIFGADQEPTGVMFIKSGFVRQFAISQNGDEVILHIFKPGTFFPMIWAMAGVANRHYFQTLSPTKGYLAPKESFLKFLKEDPKLLYHFATRLLRGIDGLSWRIEMTALSHAYSRVISILIYLSGHFGEKTPIGLKLIFPFTHQEIAELVGISREHTSLEMEKLAKKGLITYQQRFLVIPDLKKLKKELED